MMNVHNFETFLADLRKTNYTLITEKMELLSLENIERQIAEMWDALSAIPAEDPDKQTVFDNAAKSENRLREAYRKQEALRDAAPELLEALTNIVEYEERGRNNNEPRISEHWYNIAKQAIKKAEGRI